MKNITLTVYELDELNETAKERARAWYREHTFDYEWWDSTYEDAANIGLKLTSFDLDRNRHAKGQFTDTAFFCAQRIINEHGKDCETFKTATAFLAEHKNLKLVHCDADAENGLTAAGEDAIEDCQAEFLKSILEDYSIMLQKEMEYLTGDEQVDESIRANGYTFTDSGKRQG